MEAQNRRDRLEGIGGNGRRLTAFLGVRLFCIEDVRSSFKFSERIMESWKREKLIRSKIVIPPINVVAQYKNRGIDS